MSNQKKRNVNFLIKLIKFTCPQMTKSLIIGPWGKSVYQHGRKEHERTQTHNRFVVSWSNPSNRIHKCKWRTHNNAREASIVIIKFYFNLPTIFSGCWFSSFSLVLFYLSLYKRNGFFRVPELSGRRQVNYRFWFFLLLWGTHHTYDTHYIRTKMDL